MLVFRPFQYYKKVYLDVIGNFKYVCEYANAPMLLSEGEQQSEIRHTIRESSNQPFNTPYILKTLKRLSSQILLGTFFNTLSDLSFRKENETLLLLHITKILIFVLAVFEQTISKLIHFQPVFHFYAPGKHQKRFSDIREGEVIEVEHWFKMG